MDIVLSIIKWAVLVIGAMFALGIATFIFQMGLGLVHFGSMGLLGVPHWLRWIILIPGIMLAAFVLIFTFSILFWIGDLFGETFINTLWTWGTTLFQSMIVPYTVVMVSFIVAPRGRRWISLIVMLAIWLWLLGTLFDADTGDFLPGGFDLLFYFALIVASLSAAYATMKGWALEPLMHLVELEARGANLAYE